MSTEEKAKGNSAENVAQESREVDKSATTVADSSEKIDDFVKKFRV